MGAYVANRGNGIVNSTFSLTWTFTTSGAVASGNKIIVCLTNESNTVDSLSGGGLTWTKQAERKFSGGAGAAMLASIWSADAPSGLSSGTTITVVDNSSTAGDVFAKRRYSVMEASGLQTGAPASTKTATGVGTTNAPLTGTTTDSATSGDFVAAITAFAGGSISTDWSPDTGYTQEATQDGNGQSMWVEYHIASTTATVTAHMSTTLTPANWAMVMAFYPAAITAFNGSAGLIGDGQIAASGFKTNVGSAALQGHGSLSAAAGAVDFGTAHLSGAGHIAATGLANSFAVAHLSGAGHIAASGHLNFLGSAALQGHGQIYANSGSVLITVSGVDITATVAGIVTALMLVNAINASVDASALVTASHPDGDGSDAIVTIPEVHLSGGFDSSVFPPSDLNFYETVYGTGVTIQTLPDDTPLDIPGTDYAVRIIARDADGSATPSV